MIRRLYRSTTTVAALALTLGLVAGFAGPAAANGPQHRHSHAHHTRAGNKTPIKVGLLGGFTGALASTVIAARPAVQAWAKSVNAHGGINGHKVDLIVKDDQTSTTTAVADAKELIEQDHVLAIFDVSNADSEWADIAESHHVPVIPTNSSSIATLTSSNFFTPGQTIDSLPASIAESVKRVHVNKLAMFYCAESPDCSELVTPIKTAAQQAGVDLVYSTAISASAPNYTAQCLAAKSAGAKALFVGDAVSILLNVAKDCVQQGFDPVFIAEDGAVSPSFRTAPGWNNDMIATQPLIPFFVKNTPATKKMYKAFNKYAPGSVDSPNFNELAVEGWAAGLLFEQAAKAGKLGVNGTPKTSQLYKGLYSLNGTTLGGITSPLSFNKGKPTVNDCWFWMRTHNKKFTTPYGLKPQCASKS